jgi:hypothetical protein
MTFEIEGLIEHPRWYDVKCSCDHSHVDTEFPIVDCKHCKFQAQEDSMPRDSFTMEVPILDDDEEPTGETETKTCNKIIIDRGEKYQEIRGWYNQLG